ncbi:arylsulfatase [Trinickia symbiotica]|uniref:Arylsulfatase n=1 Tax=Trinickia symbiotica TaxID=863227 RepID=A0A2T3XQJ5_9BURK|nr:aspartate/glutamate racemase family protein [Trinickia symbiotica]PTB18799.1 arylsulfatase [Trinickia symbiotica]
MTRAPRISLVHATPLAIQPITESFTRWWPDATVYNLLDDSLAADLKRADGNVDAMTSRFSALVGYSLRTGADGVLFTCSAFGPAIESARRGIDVPILKPNEAMIEEALGLGRKIALVATFQPALAPIARQFHDFAAGNKTDLQVTSCFVEGAWPALQSGDKSTHDRLIAEVCARLSDHDVVCFAQFSMTSAHAAAEAASRRPTLTTTDSAVKKLKALLSR